MKEAQFSEKLVTQLAEGSKTHITDEVPALPPQIQRLLKLDVIIQLIYTLDLNSDNGPEILLIGIHKITNG